MRSVVAVLVASSTWNCTQAATMVAQVHVAHHVPMQQEMRAPSNPEVRQAPVPRQRRLTRQPVGGNRGTALGYTSGSGAQSAIVRLGLAPHVSARLGRFVRGARSEVDRIVPAGQQQRFEDGKIPGCTGICEQKKKRE
jgi:hypothetical protein